MLFGVSGTLACCLLFKPGGQAGAAWAAVTGNLLCPILGLFWWATAGRRDAAIADGAPATKRPTVWSRPNLSWLLFGASILAFFLGQVVFYYYDRVLGEPPFPSPADPFYVAAYPLQMAAVLLLPGIRGRSGLGFARLLLDSLITVGAVAVFSWFFLLGPVLTLGSLSGPAKALLTAYPAMDLAVLFCLVLVTGGVRPAAGSAMLGLSLLTLVVADTVFAYQNLHGTYVTGSLNDITWPFGYMLLGLAAAGLRARGAGAGHAPAGARAADASPHNAVALWHTALSYALLPAVCGLLIYTHASGSEDTTHHGVEVGCAVIVALIVVRQLIATIENARLNRELRAALAAGEAGHRALTLACDTLRDSEQRFRIACQSAGDLVYEWTVESNKLEWFGDVDGRLGYAAGEFPRTLNGWENAVHPDDLPRVWEQLTRHLAGGGGGGGGGGAFACEYRVVGKDGRVLSWVERGSAIRDASGRPVRMIGAIADVTSQKLAEQRLRHESLHDALTGLPNRVLFCDRVEQCVRRARRAGPGYHFAVVFLDLDRFKVINDSLGHAAGDRLLVEVSRRLQACLRDYDAVSRDVVESGAPAAPAVGAEPGAVARLGGDEFTILLDGLREPADAERVAERIQADLCRPIDFEGHELVTSASIGIIHGAPHYEAAKDLLRDADAAMYRAKQAGRARHVVFDASMHAEAVERLRTEGALRRALDRGEIVLHYQPIVSLTSGELVGFEALARWNRDGRLVPPTEFIPVAEDTGLILPIGNWVLREACRQLAEWRARQPRRAAGLTINVNLSRKQLADPQVVEQCRRALAEHALAPELLKLEITETVIMQDRQTATDALGALKRFGVTLQIDDFGTGYSSLSCLHEFPLDGLKIDREFAFNSADRDNAAIVNAIIHLAHNLGMDVVAEGIETREQLALLQALDCDSGQGVLFAGPLDAAAAERFIAATPPGTSVGRRLSA